MSRVCVSAVKVGDIIIYRSDMSPIDVKRFSENNNLYDVCPKTTRGNIYFDDDIVVLQEWDKYKVKSLSASFEPKDFHKIGEYGSDDFGTLLFKNCVGIAKFKNIKILIESPKISQAEMERLVSVVNSYIVNLSFDFNQSTFSFVERDKLQKSDLNYHVYLMVHNALSSDDNRINIFNNFKLIENNICRNMTSVIEYQDFALIPEVTEDAILEVFSGGVGMKKCNNNNIKLARKLSNPSGHYIPDELMYEEIIDTFDNPENRFIKFFISWCLDLVKTFQKSFLEQSDFSNYELLKDNEEHIKKLNYLLNQSFLKSVGELHNIPMYSTVLTMRDGYRQLFQLYLGICSMPIISKDNENIKEMIENKALDVLYENYCYFGLSEVIATIYGQRLDKKKYKVNKTDYSKTLEKKTKSNYFEFDRTDKLPKVRIHYNKNYVDESYSKAFDPDISIEIFDLAGDLNSIYVFDSKFKANIYDVYDEEGNAEERRKYKYDDISKMHTYRDALKCAHGAFVLYPGTVDELFFENESTDENLLYGVGAFKLGPGKKDDLDRIRVFIERLLRAYKEKGC